MDIAHSFLRTECNHGRIAALFRFECASLCLKDSISLLFEKLELILPCIYKMGTCESNKEIIKNRANRIMILKIFNVGKLPQLKKEKLM